MPFTLLNGIFKYVAGTRIYHATNISIINSAKFD